MTDNAPTAAADAQQSRDRGRRHKVIRETRDPAIPFLRRPLPPRPGLRQSRNAARSDTREMLSTGVAHSAGGSRRCRSQLAIEHRYRTEETSPETWAFWVHASNADRIEQGYRDTADQNGKWLLILDNVDDVAALSLPASNDPKTQSKNGSVLATSRTRSVALQLVEEGDIISIEPMDDHGAQALLQKKLGEEVDKDSTAELARALEFMPLALVQAAAYIRQRSPRRSVQQYLEEFHKSDRKRTGLLNYDGGRLRRDEGAKNSILITQPAADLLSLMSFFDRRGIPEALLHNQNKTENRHGGVEAINPSSSDSDSDDSNSEASVGDGFIGITTNTSTFDMHGLVQLATRKWLEEQGQLETWKQQYINNLCAAFPTGEHKNWAQCQALFPHAKSALLQPPKSRESLKHMVCVAKRSDAEKLSVKSMKVRKKLLGKEHTATLSSIAVAGLAAKLAGRWKEAEELEVQVMETRKRVLGEEHPSTLNAINNLAFTLKSQNRNKEAISLMESCF
ncbi:hypothetical protein GQ44DRAFT_763094 [Phaeosphaeriaceae sp. PMI808]|nr:hypothetical protein GQ44DRAFT_763094 [Phaeosphaeriaceae sp. PMI808]